jgi:hypothetical protein
VATVGKTVVGVRAVVGLGVDRVPAAALPVRFFTWKLPAASVKPIGDRSRWSCQLFTKKKTWAAFCLRLTCQLNGLFGFQEQGNGLSQNDTPGRWNGCSR